MQPQDLRYLALHLGPGTQLLPERLLLLGRPLFASRFLQHFLVVVQLHLSAGGEAHRILRSSIWSAQAKLLEVALVACFPRKAEELDGTVPSVSGHAVVGGREPGGTRHAA